MPDCVVRLEPVDIEDWEAEDVLEGVLGDDDTELLDAAQVRSMLDDVVLSLPAQLDHRRLADASGAGFDFHLLQVPLSVLIPPPSRLVRLRLRLTLDGSSSTGAVVFDRFPGPEWELREHDHGGASLDLSKALNFVFPSPIADALGLQLTLPFRWRTRLVRVRTSNRMAGFADWYVTDEAISEGFVGHLVVRAPKGSAVGLSALLEGELRRGGPAGRILKGRFRSTASDRHSYRFAPS